MPYYIISLFLLAITFVAPAQTSVSNPVSLGPIVLDQPDLDEMGKVLDYYQFTPQTSPDSTHIYRSADGTEIRYTRTIDASGYDTPYVEVITTRSKSDIEKTLKNIGFLKDKKGYHRGTRKAIRLTTCRITGTHTKHVIFTKEDGDPQLLDN